MSFSDALNKAKAVARTEKTREGDGPRSQKTTASQPRKTEEEGGRGGATYAEAFDFGDHGDVAARETLCTGDLLDVGTLGKLWRRMQLRWRCGQCGQGHPTLCIPHLHLELRFYPSHRSGVIWLFFFFLAFLVYFERNIG